MKKWLALVMAACLVLGLAACSSNNKETETNQQESTKTTAAETKASKAETKATEKETKPIETEPAEPITITIGVPLKANVTDYENNYFTQWLEENTGYNIEFMYFSATASEFKTQFATMVADKNAQWPDIIYAQSFTTTERYEYGAQGYLLDIKDYLADETLTADYRARIKELFGDAYYNNMMKSIASPDGGIYAYPSAVLSEADSPNDHVFINQAWLTKLGLEMPTNMTELVTVLKAFLTGDPNGNGKADEIPMLGANLQRARIYNWLLDNYEYVNATYPVCVNDNGKIYICYTTDAYRNGLKALYDLTKDNLLSTLTWTYTKAAEIKALWTPADGVALVGVIAGNIGTHTTQMDLLDEYVPLAAFEDAYCALGTNVPGTTVYITGETEHPLECFKLLQAMSTEAGSMALRYGKEGVDWQWATEYATGKQAIQALNPDAYSGQTKSTWACGAGNCIRYGSTTKYHTAVVNAPDKTTLAERINAKSYESAALDLAVAEKNNPKNIIDWALAYNEEEADKLGNAETDIKTYAKQQMALFATGELNPYDDKDWNNYLQAIKDMGLANWESVAQSAYDRYLAE